MILKKYQKKIPTTHAPIVIALFFLTVGGFFLLNRADIQARDTIRKHHLEDIEHSLYFARGTHGTYPPYNQSSWCGLLNDPANSKVREEIESALRTQNDKYSNIKKPFPGDPVYKGKKLDYFYWKHSPAVFELYSVLEIDKNGNRNTLNCNNAPDMYYDYGLNSSIREQ